MTLKFRRVLYIFFILVFIIIIPFLIYYAQGYRYDAQKNKLVKTGGLSINSEPTRATVYLNGQIPQIGFFEKIFLSLFRYPFFSRKKGAYTPALINNLVPNNYEVEVKKDGYIPWKKKIEIESKKVSFFDDIFLFLKKPILTTIISDDYQSAFVSPDQKLIALIKKQTSKVALEILNLDNETFQTIYTSNYALDILSWSNSARKILIKNSLKQFFVLDLKNPDNVIELAKFNLPGIALNKNIFSLLKWNENDDNILFALNNKLFYQIDLGQKNIKQIDDFTKLNLDFKINKNNSIEDYFLQENIYNREKTIFYLRTDSVNTYLEKKILSSANQPEIVALLPKNLNYVFLKTKNDLMAIKNKEKNVIILINSHAQNPSQRLIGKISANALIWSKNEKKSLYFSDFELGILNINLEKENPCQNEVVDRFSQSLKKAIWYNEEKYFIFVLNNEVKAMEMDNREQRNVVSLAKFAQIDDIFLSSQKATVFIVGELQGKKGVFKIKIQ